MIPLETNFPGDASSFEEREWFRVTLSSIGDAVIATDTLKRVIYLNPIAEEMTGWKFADAKHQPLEKVFRIINEVTRPLQLIR